MELSTQVGAVTCLYVARLASVVRLAISVPFTVVLGAKHNEGAYEMHPLSYSCGSTDRVETGAVLSHWEMRALCAGVQCGAPDTAHELPAILRAAEQAASKSNWPAVKQCLGELRSLGLASNLDLGVQALLLQAEALRNLQQLPEALEVSSCTSCRCASCNYT
jgi:hypothetical protein